MATDYSKLTREELVEALGAMAEENARLGGQAKMMRETIAIAVKQDANLRTELIEAQQRASRDRRLRGITLEVSASLARAWVDIVEHLRE